MKEYYNEETGVGIEKPTVTVSEYLDALNKNLKKEKAKIIGEVSGIQEYSGRSYMYFSIKDTKDSSTMKCFMWKRDYTLSGVSLAEGMEVVVNAYPNIYKPNGGLTLQVEGIELVGEGALKLAYEKLKMKLALEGLFDISRKRALPILPKRIGILTSKNGAVINDFLSNIGHFGFELIFVDTKVEGVDAVKDLLSGLRTLYTEKLDLLVLMRGGGSLESFQAFNNEAIVRAISKFNAPVITGIGHDKDAPLVSMVSDQNVSTPTAVAHLLSQPWRDIIHTISLSEEKIFRSFETILQDSLRFVEQSEYILSSAFQNLFDIWKSTVEQFNKSIYTFEYRLQTLNEYFLRTEEDLLSFFTRIFEEIDREIQHKKELLSQFDPYKQLALGWSIVKNKKGILVRKTSDVVKDEEIELLVSDGTINSKVV